MTLETLIRRLQDVMRKDTGVDGDAQRLQQMVWLIFLKVFDYKEEEAELDDAYTPVIPEGYRWRDWADVKDVKEQMTGPELLDFVSNKLIPVLSGNTIRDETGKLVTPFDKTDPRSLLVKSFMSDAQNYMKNGYLLRDVVNLFNSVDLEDSGEAHDFNDMYETLLKSLQSAGNAGEFYTGRAITSFAIDHLKPELGGVLADWSAGTGGFLIDGLQYMEKQVQLGDSQALRQLHASVRGGEWKPLPYKLLVTNLLLHGVELPDIRYGDSLSEKNVSEYRGDDLVDWEAMNPPYGGVALKEDLMSFPADMRSSETADLFVALAVKRLKKGGRAIIVLPDGFLFGTDGPKLNIKKDLLKQCNLHTIIRLPESCFSPYTSIATNLLFFDKTGPTEEIWFYRLDMPDGYKHFSKTKPMKREHFAPVDEWWDNRVEIKDEKTDDSLPETWKAKKYSIDELADRNFDLDLCGFPAEKKIVLSPEETMNTFIVERTQLEKNLADATSRMNRYLNGEKDVELVEIKPITDKLCILNNNFPEDMKLSLIQAAMQGDISDRLSTDTPIEKTLIEADKKRATLLSNKIIAKQKTLPISNNDILFDLPSEWQWVRLGTLFQHNAGKALNSKNTIGVKRQYITTSNVYWDHFELDQLREMYYTDDEIVRYSVRKGDMLVLEGGDVGRTAIWNLDVSYCIQNHLHRLRPLADIDIKYFYYIMYYYKNVTKIAGKGIGIKGLSSNVLHNILFPLPPVEEQHRIVEKLDKLIPLCSQI